jgi:hypothetical protein
MTGKEREMKPESPKESSPKGTVHTGTQVLMRLAGALAVLVAIIVAWKYIVG